MSCITFTLKIDGGSSRNNIINNIVYSYKNIMSKNSPKSEELLSLKSENYSNTNQVLKCGGCRDQTTDMCAQSLHYNFTTAFLLIIYGF